MQKKDMPELDEFVIATIKKIYPYGAFCVMDEYDNKEAFIHISEVAPRWIKNIHEFLKEDQKVVAKVFKIIPDKNQIDLSLKRVSESDRRKTLDSSKKEKRAAKLFELTAKKLNKKYEDACKVEAKLVEEFGDLYSAFEEIAEDGKKISGLGIGEDWEKGLFDIASQNIRKPIIKIVKVLVLSCTGSEGVEAVRDALVSAKKLGSGKTSASISYLGAPRYMVTVTGEDYKSAEKIMEDVIASVHSSVQDKNCKAAIEKEGAKGE